MRTASCYTRPPPNWRGSLAVRSTGVLLDVTRHLFMSGKPHPRPSTHVLDQLFQDADARAVPNDVGVHREQEEATLSIRPIKLPAPDFAHQRWRRMRTDGREAIHAKVGVIVFNPFHWQLHDTRRLAIFDQLVGLIVAH